MLHGKSSIEINTFSFKLINENRNMPAIMSLSDLRRQEKFFLSLDYSFLPLLLFLFFFHFSINFLIILLFLPSVSHLFLLSSLPLLPSILFLLYLFRFQRFLFLSFLFSYFSCSISSSAIYFSSSFIIFFS